MTGRVPAEVFAPGEFISEELEARSWSQIELAEIMGRPARLISELISGKRAITPETAKGLGAAFGTGPEYWMNLERDYRLAHAIHDDIGVERRANLYARAPVKEMIKRGWIESSDNIDVLEKRVYDFLRTSNSNNRPSLAYAAKNGGTYSRFTPSQLAWLFRVEQLARASGVPKYSQRKLKNALKQLESLMIAPEDVRNVPGILAACGVRFIVVEKLPQAKIDGACFWIEEQQPVIGMSIRRDTIDNFWFVLRHELEHVLREDGKNAEIVDDLEGRNAGTDSDLPEEERTANSTASDFCAPKLEAFMARKHPFYYERDVLAFSKTINRHPGIVVGEMQLRLNNYAYLAKHLAKIRSFLLPASIFDGWGQAALPDEPRTPVRDASGRSRSAQLRS
jgi:HTH-type transcriptional regulator/antitoxin HigA